MTEPPRPEPDPGRVPSRGDAVVRWAGEWLGGATGTRAVVGWNGWTRPASLLVAAGSVLLALGVVAKGHCVANGWVAPDQYWRMCYSDVPVVPVSSGLTTGAGLFDGAPSLGQPPLTGLLLHGLAALSPGGTGVATQQVLFGLWAALAVLLLAGAVVGAAWLRPGAPWQAAHLALSPVLVTAALVSTDLLGVALTVWALWAWRSRRPGLGGVLFALALLTRLLPLALLVAVVLVGLRRDQRRELATLVGSVLVTLAVVCGPFLVLQPGLVTGWWDAWRTATPGYGSLQLLFSLSYEGVVPLTLSASTATAIATLGWVIGLAVGVWAAMRRGSDEVATAAAVLVPVLLTASAVPVQVAVWMLPLLALAGARWRDHLVWAACEIVYFGAVWLYLGASADAERGLPAVWFAAATLLRWMGWTWMLARVARGGRSSRATAPTPVADEGDVGTERDDFGVDVPAR